MQPRSQGKKRKIEWMFRKLKIYVIPVYGQLHPIRYDSMMMMMMMI
jgi:hypothetical protein